MFAHIPRGSVTVFPLPAHSTHSNKGPQLRLLLFPSTCLDLLFALLVIYHCCVTNYCKPVSSSNKFTAYYSVSLGKGSRHSFLGPLALILSKGVIKMQGFSHHKAPTGRGGGGANLLRSLP